jgi:hypothetical protein
MSISSAERSLLFFPPDILSKVTLKLDLDDLVQLIRIGNSTWSRHLFAHGSVTSLYSTRKNIKPQHLTFFFQALPELLQLDLWLTKVSVEFAQICLLH